MLLLDYSQGLTDSNLDWLILCLNSLEEKNYKKIWDVRMPVVYDRIQYRYLVLITIHLCLT